MPTVMLKSILESPVGRVEAVIAANGGKGQLQINAISTYTQRLLERGSLVLRILGDSGVGSATLAAPCLPGAGYVPVLVSGLSKLSPHFHQVIRVCLHQGLSGEQTKV